MSRRVITILCAVAAVAVLAYFGYSEWQKSHNAALQGRVDRGQLEAGAAAGVDALNTVAEADAARRETDALVEAGRKEIEDAEGSDQAVTDDSRCTALLAACRLPIYRHTEQCAAVSLDPACQRPADPDAADRTAGR